MAIAMRYSLRYGILLPSHRRITISAESRYHFCNLVTRKCVGMSRRRNMHSMSFYFRTEQD